MMRRVALKAANTAWPAVVGPAALRFPCCTITTSTLDKSFILNEIKSKGIFDPILITNTLNRLLEGFSDTTYLANVNPGELSNHVQGILTAEASKRMGGVFEYIHEGEDKAFYICSDEPSSKLRMVRKAAAYVSRPDIPAGHGVLTRSYIAKDRSFAVYIATIDPFLKVNPKEGEVNLEKLATSKVMDDITPEHKERVQKLLSRVQTSVFLVFDITEKKGTTDTVCFTMATMDQNNYIASLLAIFQEIDGAEVLRTGFLSLSNGARIYDFEIKGVTRKQVKEQASIVGLVPCNPQSHIGRLHEEGVLTSKEATYIESAVIFAFYFTPSPTGDDYSHLRALLQNEPNGINRLNSLRVTLSLEMMSERYMGALIKQYTDLMKLIYKDFELGSTEERRASIAATITNRFHTDERSSYDLAIFKSFLKFNEVVLKHNFFKTEKAALAFRLDPKFLKDLDYPQVPHGIFLFAGLQWRGFHVRFTDIARGGVRMVISLPSAYRKNKRSIFKENYNLAHTQLLKNKDIPEGGSKGTILVSPRYLKKFDEMHCKRIFLQYTDAMLDLIIPGTPDIIDNLQKEETIFLGPDENTAGSFPTAGAFYSKHRGYSWWKSFTTGKDPLIGGIPHDVYGMTTRSVRTYVKCIYKELGLREEEMRKFQTGGPDGDLGSNEILKSKEVVIGLVDVSASLHDPNGLDREELARLARHRLTLQNFDRSKLSKDGFLVLTEDHNVTLPDGTFVENGSWLRNDFHFLKYSDADIFVPCGGRPRSVTLANVGRFLKVPDAHGESMLQGHYESIGQDQLKFKIIVEGANLFLSQDARLALERCGVVVIKDASSNKGGVTSSSLEVLAGLCMSDEEHAKYMSAKSSEDAPEFYKKYVQEILLRLELNAEKEFQAIWREWKKDPSRSRTLIADALSSKNVKIRAKMLESDIFKNKELVRSLMQEYVPRTLLEVIPIDVILQRVPESYQHAICAMWLASNYVYSTDTDSSEFEFFNFMTEKLRGISAQHA